MKSNGSGGGILSEMLCVILVAQRAAKLWEVKVIGSKKLFDSAREPLILWKYNYYSILAF